MSPSTKITHVARTILATVSGVAVLATFAAGLGGLTATPAGASIESGSGLLGIDSDQTVVLSEPASATAKFDELGNDLTGSDAATEPAFFSEETTPSVECTLTSAEASLGAEAPKASIIPAVGEFRRVDRAYGRRWRSARVSWYGPRFYGHGMAGGGRLQRNSMVVAHRSLPFGTKVQIVYKNRTVTAVVKDRGPYVSGRAFDLGPGIAKGLKFRGVGTIHYRIVSRPARHRH